MIDISTRDGVLDNLKATIQGINGEAGGFLYKVDARNVVRDPVNIVAVPTTSLPFFVVEPTTNGSKQYVERPNRLLHIFEVLITARMDAVNSLEPDRKSKVAERLIRDIEKAVQADITRGGRCVDTTIGEATALFSIGPDNIVIVLQPVTVRIRRAYGQP